MTRQKEFNVTGPCIPNIHYMVDINNKLAAIVENYIDKGMYFTMNRARQYGKTTTLGLIENAIAKNYIPLSISFEGFGSSVFMDESGFISAFIASCAESMEYMGVDDNIIDAWAQESAKLNFPALGKRITNFAKSAGKRVILMIDEVDRSSNNQLFLDFLGLLRDKYITRSKRGTPTFHSVILAGVHDIKNLKNKLRPEDKHTYNSPWNIAANFNVDMSFTAQEIETMISEYERNYHTGMNIAEIARRIYYYTNGYPFLVSAMCKVIHDNKLEWSVNGVNEAERIIITERNTLFDDVTKNLENNPSFSALAKRVLLQGAQIIFEDQNPDIDIGLMYGILAKDANGFVKVSNIIFETRMYNYFVSIEATSANFDNVASEKRAFIKAGLLDVASVLKRFSALMYAEYRSQNSDFLEKHAGLLFLCYLKPIINGTGHYVIEPETRGGRRMDIVVFYGAEEHIIELKIWRGEKYEEKGIEQLTRYLDSRGQRRGYLLSFCDNAKAPREGKTHIVGGCEITEVIVVYRNKAQR